MESPQSLFESLTYGHVHPFNPGRLKTFGSLCYATDKNHKSKVGPLACRYIFVGLEEGAHAVRLWDKDTRRILVSGNVIHREEIFSALDKNHAPVFDDTTFHHTSDLLLSLSAAPPTFTSRASTEELINPQTTVTSTSDSQVSPPPDLIPTHSTQPEAAPGPIEPAVAPTDQPIVRQ